MLKSPFKPHRAWLVLAGIFRSLLDTIPVAVPMEGGYVARLREADCGELGVCNTGLLDRFILYSALGLALKTTMPAIILWSASNTASVF